MFLGFSGMYLSVRLGGTLGALAHDVRAPRAEKGREIHEPKPVGPLQENSHLLEEVTLAGYRQPRARHVVTGTGESNACEPR